MLDNVNGAKVAASQRNRVRSIYVQFIDCSMKKTRSLGLSVLVLPGALFSNLWWICIIV